ncbi:MAG: type II toxin-antitoxin system prevent-host-death family antitoxin [Myxococcales bacterium]|nr:type II toxin-antitoxin system prevent-host-death family antitoxin [Myxococcales bacterium]
MNVSTKELRIQPGKIIDQVVNGQEITVTFRGKAIVKIVPIDQPQNAESKDDDGIFGMWKDGTETSVDDTVREMRKGRHY